MVGRRRFQSNITGVKTVFCVESLFGLLVVALIVTASPALAQEANLSTEETLTLEQAVGLAIRNNRQVQTATLNVEKALNQRTAARARLFPTLDLNVASTELLRPVEFNFPAGAFGTFPMIGPFPPKEVTLTESERLTTLINANLIQPLTQLSRIRLGIQASEAGIGVAREAVRLQRQTTAENVRHAYFGLLQAQSGIAAAEESLRFYEELERVTANYVANQTALEGDLLEVRAKQARQKYDLLVLQDTLATGKEQLNLLLGRDVHTPFQVQPLSASAASSQDLPTLQNRALHQRPELRQAQFRIQQASADLRSKQAEGAPDLSLALSYVEQLNLDIVPARLFSIGLVLTWQPLDWGKRRSETAERRHTLEQARLGSREAEAQILVDVDSLYRRLREAQSLVEVAQAAQAAAREKQRVALNRYREKAALLRDALEAQATLADADRQVQQAVLSLATAQADLTRAVGEE